MKILTTTLVALLLTGLAGCTEERLVAPEIGPGEPFANTLDKSIEVITQTDDTPPPGLVTVAVAGGEVTCWPFTGRSFDGVGVDPVNLIFTGQAEPLQIREALLGLDADRSVLGLDPVYPFDQRWHDALGGDVQTSYDQEGGWLGSVIQLTLGDYEPLRFHLRLFRTGATTPAGEPITLGAAHLEVLIPGTSEHQVISWEAAEQMVTADLMRSGLLDPAQHIGLTGQINPAPSWRTIIPDVYNGLPPELIDLIQGPEQPQEDPVPIGTDGCATTIHLAAALPVAPMEYTTCAPVEFGQFIPRPFCSSGPYDWLHITGGVEFTTTVLVDAAGNFTYTGGYAGTIIATPVDIGTGQPVGETFCADVRGTQQGWFCRGTGRVVASDRKLSHEDGGSQINIISLQIGDYGRNGYKAFNKCLDDL